MSAESSKTVLVIVAHADDMEFMAGGTIAKMSDLVYTLQGNCLRAC